MHVTDGVVAQILVEPLQALADDGGPQVADVQGLCHVGSAVVHHNGFALPRLVHAELGGCAHFLQIGHQKMAGELQVDEAGVHRLHQAVVLGVQLGRHRFGDLDGGAVVLLGGG